MTEGFNGDNWILHFLDDMTRMNFVYTSPNKDQVSILGIIHQFVAFVDRQFGYKIKTFRTDGESSLGKESIAWIKDDGYKLEQSPPYTPDQNGAAERSGKSILIKARTIRISANLSANIWPEVVKTAGYLLNRTPTRVLDWKSPIEALQARQGISDPKPSIAHLKVYGCRAYPLIQEIPRKQKLNPRAQIGYLVGYESTNIFRIWIPEKHQVIKTRDVTFDELRKYHPDDLRTALAERVEEPLQLIEFPEDEELAEGVDGEWETRSIDSDISSTIEVIPRDASSEDA
jgi:hypothetical protein